MTERLQRHRTGDDGFTLAELLVGMVLLGILGSLILSLVTSTSRAQVKQVALADVLVKQKTALNRVTQDIRAASPIVAATPTTLRFVQSFGGTAQQVRLTIEPNGATEKLVQSVLSLDGSTVTSSKTALTGLAAGQSRFDYVDAARAELADSPTVSQIAIVRLTTVVQLKGTSKSALTEEIELRN